MSGAIRSAAQARRLVWERLEIECSHLIDLGAFAEEVGEDNEREVLLLERAAEAVRNTINCRIMKMLKAEKLSPQQQRSLRSAKRRRGRYITRWKLVKVTIRPKRNKEREAVVRWLHAQRDGSWGGSIRFWAQKFADEIDRGEHRK